jgi:putative Mg2+ transporter-C (MgtC) family protein
MERDPYGGVVSGPAAGLAQYGDLLLALGLSSAVGLERELRQRAAGLRTHALVGLASALIMLVSKYGFSDVIGYSHVVLDPSRIAAQIVSGIGFIGGGIIFVRRDVVRGLTTAATIWVVAGVGMACGAGLPLLALATTGGHFLVVFAYPPLTRALHRARRTPTEVQLDYRDGEGVLRRVLGETTARGFSIGHVETHARDGRTVSLLIRVAGSNNSITDLAAALSEVDGVLAVNAGDFDEP